MVCSFCRTSGHTKPKCPHRLYKGSVNKHKEPHGFGIKRYPYFRGGYNERRRDGFLEYEGQWDNGNRVDGCGILRKMKDNKEFTIIDTFKGNLKHIQEKGNLLSDGNKYDNRPLYGFQPTEKDSINNRIIKETGVTEYPNGNVIEGDIDSDTIIWNDGTIITINKDGSQNLEYKNGDVFVGNVQEDCFHSGKKMYGTYIKTNGIKIEGIWPERRYCTYLIYDNDKLVIIFSKYTNKIINFGNVDNPNDSKYDIPYFRINFDEPGSSKHIIEIDSEEDGEDISNYGCYSELSYCDSDCPSVCDCGPGDAYICNSNLWDNAEVIQ